MERRRRVVCLRARLDFLVWRRGGALGHCAPHPGFANAGVRPDRHGVASPAASAATAAGAGGRVVADRRCRSNSFGRGFRSGGRFSLLCRAPHVRVDGRGRSIHRFVRGQSECALPAIDSHERSSVLDFPDCAAVFHRPVSADARMGHGGRSRDCLLPGNADALRGVVFDSVCSSVPGRVREE